MDSLRRTQRSAFFASLPTGRFDRASNDAQGDLRYSQPPEHWRFHNVPLLLRKTRWIFLGAFFDRSAFRGGRDAIAIAPTTFWGNIHD
jgi:hypothetical protein